jgi:adenylyltransferase/sulfurtransferase
LTVANGTSRKLALEHHRYHRQELLPQIGKEGQARLAAARVALVGCGALGSVIAEQLVRAGVGFVRVIDRDVVEWTNLQRQVLFDEVDAREGLPKAVAAQRRLERVNGSVTVQPVVADVHSGNVEALMHTAQVILDGTDNVETRYLLNDVAVKRGVPWVYGGCVGAEGRVMPVVPGVTACLRCLFREPQAGAELPTCDTAGVLGPAVGVVASLQSIHALKLLTGSGQVRSEVWHGDLWAGRMRTMAVERRTDCPACGRHEFAFLDRPSGQTTTLCGRQSVQVRPAGEVRLDLSVAARKLESAGEVQRTPYLVRCRVQRGAVDLTVFTDGRMIVTGTTDPEWARSLYARYVGA